MANRNNDFDWKAAEADVEDFGGDIDMLSRHNERERDAYLRELELNPERYKPKGGSEPSSSGGEGCYVATCIYGSYDCPEVWTLRRYRDSILSLSWYGRAFVRSYYTVSPTLVKWFGKTSWFRAVWKPFLDKMVKRLNKQGISNTSYKD